MIMGVRSIIISSVMTELLSWIFLHPSVKRKISQIILRIISKFQERLFCRFRVILIGKEENFCLHSYFDNCFLVCRLGL